jgi:hypothetical protein
MLSPAEGAISVDGQVPDILLSLSPDSAAVLIDGMVPTLLGVSQPTAQSDGGARWPPLNAKSPKRHPRYAKYKLHPEEILRQQRMVEEYLASLESKAPTAQEPHKKAPTFTPALARAAADVQLVKVVRAAAEARDRDMAALELRRRRHLTLALLLALD